MDTVVQPISVCDLSRQTEVDLSEENWIVWVADVQQLSGLILCSTTIKSEENWIVWVADVQQLSGLILCSTTIKSEENWIVWVADVQQLSGLILCSTTIMVTSSSHVSCVM